MKEKPAFRDKCIIDHLREAYGVDIAQLGFLPSGDINSAKYQATSADLDVFFLKLVKGCVNEISVTVPHYLHGQGIYEYRS